MTRAILLRPGLGAAALLALASLGFSSGCTFVEARMEMKRGNESFNLQRFETAVDAYKKVIEIDPTYKEAHLNLGLAYLTLYQPGSPLEKDAMYARGAIEAFQDYLLLDPTNEDVENYLIEMANQSGNEELVARYFEEQYRRHPDDIHTLQLLGNLYQKMGDIDTAIKWMQKRIDLEPDNPEAYYTIGVNCWARSYNRMDLTKEQRFEVLDRGLAALDKAIELKPDYGDAYAYKNLIYRQKAAFADTPEERVEFNNMADEYQAKAVEFLKAKREAEEAEAKAADEAAAAKANEKGGQ